jgi:hypothetical protein
MLTSTRQELKVAGDNAREYEIRFRKNGRFSYPWNAL